MRSIQVCGLISLLVCWMIGHFLDGGSGVSEQAGAVTAIGLVYFAFPFMVISFLLLVPSSVALMWPSIRQRSGFNNVYWLTLLTINTIISVFYIALIIYIVSILSK